MPKTFVRDLPSLVHTSPDKLSSNKEEEEVLEKNSREEGIHEDNEREGGTGLLLEIKEYTFQFCW